MLAPEIKQFADPAAPEFSEKAWNKEGIIARVDGQRIWLVPGANCYQYAAAGSAADGSNNIIREDEIPNPGVTGNVMRPFNLSSYMDAPDNDVKVANLLNALVADGFELAGKGDVPPAKPGYYVMGAYLKEGKDYHFVRQDRDGGWSSKEGVDIPVTRYLEPNPDGSYKKLEGRYGESEYMFVTYVYVPAKGVNLGFEIQVANSLKQHPEGEALAEYFNTVGKMKIDQLRFSLALHYPQEIVDRFDTARERYTRVVHPDAPVFDEMRWDRFKPEDIHVSDFQYAFGGSDKQGDNNIFQEQVPLPGNTGGLLPKKGAKPDDTALIARLSIDGIEVLNKNTLPATRPGHYLVGIYQGGDGQPYFVRQDRDGGWSMPQRVDKDTIEIMRIHQPPKDGKPIQLEQHNGIARLIGYSYAPSGGINLGLEVAVAAKLDKNPDGGELKHIFERVSPEGIAELGKALANHYDQKYVDQFEAARMKYTPPVAKKPDEPSVAR